MSNRLSASAFVERLTTDLLLFTAAVGLTWIVLETVCWSTSWVRWETERGRDWEVQTVPFNTDTRAQAEKRGRQAGRVIKIPQLQSAQPVHSVMAPVAQHLITQWQRETFPFILMTNDWFWSVKRTPADFCLSSSHTESCDQHNPLSCQVLCDHRCLFRKGHYKRLNVSLKVIEKLSLNTQSYWKV